MASGIFALLDDIAVLMDDAAAMSKIAAKKTAGILGDDLAVNAEKATGFHASRELPVLWAITKGSFINKLIILPLAFLLSAYAPWLIVPILLLGGAYLSYEGADKIIETLIPHQVHTSDVEEVSSDPNQILQQEQSKIKSAVRTDFILSIEIIILALGTVIQQTIVLQVIVVSVIAIVATIGVYGLVALLVRMDDSGFYLIERSQMLTGITARAIKTLGQFLVAALPKVIRALSIVGTIAMLLVGGSMFVHNIDAVHHVVDFMPSLVAELLVGLVVGAILVGLMQLIQRFR